MTKLGSFFREKNIRVRSGHADGADWAFEQGTREVCDVFIPWAGFNSVKPYLGFVHILDKTPAGTLYRPRLENLVRNFHPAPDKLSTGVRKLMQRNCLQVLGSDLS